MKIHLNIVVSGRVQKVGFRYYTRIEALLRDVKGFVQNRPDGSVYIEAEGEEAAVYSLLDWCKIGPSMASVEESTVEIAVVKGFESFEII